MHAQNGGWCLHHKLAVPGFRQAPPHHDWSCFFRPSSTMLRRRLILGANFEHCVVSYLFRLIVFIFPRHLRCVRGVWAAFDYLIPLLSLCIVLSCFHSSSFFCFAQYCLSKIPLLCMGESDKAPTNKICCCGRASGEQCPRKRFCYESERLVQALLGQTYLLGSLFPYPVREQLAISASGDGRILCRVKKHKIVIFTLVSQACPFSSNVSFVNTE